MGENRSEDEFLSKEKLKAEWDRRASRSGEMAVLSSRYPVNQAEEGSRKYVESVMKFIGSDIDEKDVLEIGSGIGRVTERIVDRAARVTCLDPSPRMIERNKQRLGVQAQRVTYIETFIQDYEPIPHDVIICSLILIHNPDLLFQSMVKVMSNCANTIFLFEHTDVNAQTSPFTFIRSESELIAAFPMYRVAKRKKYTYFADEISFLKLVR